MPKRKTFSNLEDYYADKIAKTKVNPNQDDAQKEFNINLSGQNLARQQAVAEKYRSGKKKMAASDGSYTFLAPEEASRQYILRQQPYGRSQLQRERDEASRKRGAEKAALNAYSNAALKDAEETFKKVGRNPFSPSYGMGTSYNAKGGEVKRMAKGGSVKSASSRADGCAVRGKTRA
jgi:hypothetical protein